jgi:flagellar biosynthesis/type III secretory pathway protein FliH
VKKWINLILLIALAYVNYQLGKADGYNQGRFDAQNECIIEQEVSDQLSLDTAMENARWQCSSRIQQAIDQCNMYCGSVTI